MTNLSVPIVATIAVAWNSAAVPALAAIAGERASMRFLEFCSARSAAAPASSPALCCQGNAYAIIRRGARRGQDRTKLGNQSFRVTGITAYLRNGGTLERPRRWRTDARDAALRPPAR